MNAVEINSSFHRPHRKATYERWAATTPSQFKFCVKVPKRITHEKQLQNCEAELNTFLDEVSGLQNKLGPLLVQLPPRLAWNGPVAMSFFSGLRAGHDKALVCEPRHASWFGDEPAQQLAELGIGRVAADPSVVPAAAVPAGDMETCYFRWHGSPRIYRSSYDSAALTALAVGSAHVQVVLRPHSTIEANITVYLSNGPTTRLMTRPVLEIAQGNLPDADKATLRERFEQAVPIKHKAWDLNPGSGPDGAVFSYYVEEGGKWQEVTPDTGLRTFEARRWNFAMFNDAYNLAP